MTCAGIASLVIAGDVLHEPDAKVSGDQIDGCYRASSEDQDRIERGIDWLRRHFTVQANPPVAPAGSRLWHYYYLYGLERAGRLTARRKIGEYDWYREGASYLVQAIGTVVSRSSWKGSGHAEDNEDIATSLALLFLSKGRWPVLMAKVQYRPAGPAAADADLDWNRHRNDVNNLTMYVESQWRRELTWQVIDLSKASVDDLLQVPVLFFSGGGNPLPQKAEERAGTGRQPPRLHRPRRFHLRRRRRLLQRVRQGLPPTHGLVFQKPEYRFKKLDASHPIWHADQKIPPEQVRLLLGIDYGCRTSVVYAPCDPPDDPKPSLACLWELSRGGQRASYQSGRAGEDPGRPGDRHQRAGLCHQPRVAGEGPHPRDGRSRRDPSTKCDRGKFAVAKLQHPGGCDAAPRALANLMEQAGHELNIRVETHPKLIGMQDPALFDYPVVFMHGRNAFRLTDGERQALREYVQRGGLLFADAICGSEAFAESFRREMGIIFPKNPLENIPPRDPIWTNKYGGSDLDDGHASRPAAGPAGRAVEVGPPPRSARAEGRSFRRPLWGDLLGVRSELCPGEARLDGMPRLHPRRRGQNRPERAALRDPAVIYFVRQ